MEREKAEQVPSGNKEHLSWGVGGVRQGTRKEVISDCGQQYGYDFKRPT